MIRELDSVALIHGLRDLGLERGAVGAVVFVHQDGNHFEVEFVSPRGETLALSTLRFDQIRRVAFDEETSEPAESQDAALGPFSSP